jgi:asparagine synthase (glutamine-hydrolysing)
MCGILAVVDFKNRNIRRDLLVRLRDTMFHRGPDDKGMFVEGSVGLGHRRLSIIDLTRQGHQPMTNEDRSLQLVFNGEIYNYVELRETLRARGHSFASSSDTEVILHQYEEDGERCVEKFRGMFAFALWDSRRQRLFAARDRFGIKPLYYFRDADRVLLASEIKAIVEDERVPRRPDLTAIADYLYAGRALGDKTMFADVRELEPGCWLTIDRRSGSVEIQRYWDLRYDYKFSRPVDVTAEELYSTIDESVAVHCRSDAPLGCHLSGGLDSSTVVAFAARHRERLKTFSIKFSQDEYIDETPYAKAAARHVEAQYLECTPTADEMADALPFLVWHMDGPMATDGGFAYFTVSEFARKHVKVSLTGHGGDEIFAGYPSQFQATFNRTDMFRQYEDPHRIPGGPGLFRRALRKGPLGIYRSLRNRVVRPQPSLEDLWVATHCDPLPRDNPFLHTAFRRAVNGYSPRDEYVKPFATVATDQTLDKCLYHDLRIYLPGLLHLEDRVSMAVSLESRVPLLDHRIVEFLATVPPEQKVAGLEPKYLLRRIGSSLLPHQVRNNRTKRNFPIPGSFWKTGRLSALVKEVLLSKECIDRGIFSRQSLQEACNNCDYNTDFWRLVNVELWFRIFIDKDRFWLERAKQHIVLSALS